MSKRYAIGVGHDGKSNAFARPGEPTLVTHHDPQSARSGDVAKQHANLKPGAPKQLTPVSVHGGMTNQQHAGAGVGGMGHPTTVVSGGQKIPSSAVAAPLAHAYGTVLKERPAAQINPGARGRNGDNAAMLAQLGRRVIDEAVKN